MNRELQSFHTNLLQEIQICAEVADEPISMQRAFLELIEDILVNAGEVSSIEPAYKKAKGFEVSAYSLEGEEDTTTLNVFVLLLDESELPNSISEREMQGAIARLAEFVTRAVNGLANSIDEVDEAFALAKVVEDGWNQFSEVKFIVVTNRCFNGELNPVVEVSGRTASVQIWDLVRIHRLQASGQNREAISIDVVARLGRPLRCLKGPDLEDHSVYLVVFPGEFLAEIYSEYGPRLLERNVRAFLQTKGSVNKGIRSTILNQPDRFLAFNNGISATASSVEVSRDADGDLSIEKIQDLQIVNGGQTTASLASVHRRDDADLSLIAVQAKITVVAPEVINELVPFISQYSNTQNKVTTADFFANDPFHVAIEELSRSMWAPSSDGVRAQTRWFYERARGQYSDELARAGTPAQQRRFKSIYPPNQKFTKTDLAKYENSWFQLPHLVSLGAEKNFRHFALSRSEKPTPCDEQYFRHLIAKAILFRSADRIVAEQNFGGYKVNIVSYTIAKLSFTTRLMLDLDEIWRQQSISSALVAAIEDLCHKVAAQVMNPQGRSRHVGEWTKKIDCWTVVRDLEWTIPKGLSSELRNSPTDEIRSNNLRTGVEIATGDDVEAIEYCLEFGADTWLRLARWGKETKVLAPYQNGIAYGIGKAISNPRKGKPSPKQAVQGRKMMVLALEKGFQPS
jgi:hypothetical protein